MADANNFVKKPTSACAAVAIFILTILSAPIFPTGGDSASSVLSLALSGGGTAWLFFRSGYLPGITAAVSGYFLAWYLSGSPIYAIAALSIIPCGLTYSFVSKRRLSQSRAVGISTVIISCLSFIIIFLSVFSEAGAFNLSAIKSVFSSFFEAIRAVLTESFTVTIAGQTVPFITADNTEQYINMIIGIMPGVIVMMISTLCFAAGWVYKALLALTHSEKPEPSDWKLLPAPITAAFFCIAVLFSAVSGSNTLVWLSSLNISLMLIPGFFFSGIASITEVNIVNGIPHPKILRTVLIFLAFLSGFPALIATASLFGVIDSVKTIMPKKDNKT